LASFPGDEQLCIVLEKNGTWRKCKTRDNDEKRKKDVRDDMQKGHGLLHE